MSADPTFIVIMEPRDRNEVVFRVASDKGLSPVFTIRHDTGFGNPYSLYGKHIRELHGLKGYEFTIVVSTTTSGSLVPYDGEPEYR